jgi:hypothetical protein
MLFIAEASSEGETKTIHNTTTELAIMADGGNNSRGRGGPTRGHWTRGERNNRGNTSKGRGYQQRQNNYSRLSREEGGSNQSDRGKNRYERGGTRGGANKQRLVFDRLGVKSGKGKEFGRLVRNNGRPVNERRVSFQSMDNDLIEEDTSSVLLNVLGERYDSLNMSLGTFHDETLQDNLILGSMF